MTQQFQQEILPLGWDALYRDDRTSTVAHFVGGYEHGAGFEVLIWRGVDEIEDDEEVVVIETSSDDYTRGVHEYVVEILYNGNVVEQIFEEELEDAWNTVNNVVIGNKPHEQ